MTMDDTTQAHALTVLAVGALLTGAASAFALPLQLDKRVETSASALASSAKETALKACLGEGARGLPPLPVPIPVAVPSAATVPDLATSTRGCAEAGQDRATLEADAEAAGLTARAHSELEATGLPPG